jgi:hypothetical protein
MRGFMIGFNAGMNGLFRFRAIFGYEQLRRSYRPAASAAPDGGHNARDQSAFDHDRGAEAVAIEYLHVRVES